VKYSKQHSSSGEIAVKFSRILMAVVITVLLTGTGHAWILNFEWGLGHNYEQIQSGIPGLNFASDMFYADATSGSWNYSSDNGDEWGTGEYWIGDLVGAHASTNGMGRIDFANADGSWFTTGYCAGNTFYVEAYDAFDNLIDVASGAANRRYLEGNAAGMDYLTVSSASNNIAYVVLHDAGYYWVADNMSGDASGVYSPVIPEPATVTLFGLGMLGLAALRRRNRK
jgi:hypothetical protein